MKPRLIVACMLIALPIVLAACAPQASELSGSDRDAVLAYSEERTDNLLQGINANDYAVLSRDFDDAMKKAMPESGLANLQKQVTGVIGNYVSREVLSVSAMGDTFVVVYSARFEKEDGVTVRVVFGSGEPHKITGLWFDSPKLRGK